MKISLTITTLQKVMESLKNNGSLNITNLAKKLKLTQPTVSLKLREIEKLGIVELQFSDRGHRGGVQKIYSLNKKGEELLKLLGDSKS